MTPKQCIEYGGRLVLEEALAQQPAGAPISVANPRDNPAYPLLRDSPSIFHKDAHSSVSFLRLQAWAVMLSEEKRSFVSEIKARAPAEVVGAHMRFIARTGTWERLLLDLNVILESAIREREEAVGLLSRQCTSETPGAPPGHVLRTPLCEP